MSNAHNHILQDIRWRFRGGIICLDDCDVNFLLNQIDQVEELEALVAKQRVQMKGIIDLGTKQQATIERVRWCVNEMDNVLWRGVGAKLKQALEEVGDE